MQCKKLHSQQVLHQSGCRWFKNYTKLSTFLDKPFDSKPFYLKKKKRKFWFGHFYELNFSEAIAFLKDMCDWTVLGNRSGGKGGAGLSLGEVLGLTQHLNSLGAELEPRLWGAQGRLKCECCRKGGPFQGPGVSSCLTLRHELSEETQADTARNFMGKGHMGGEQ